MFEFQARWPFPSKIYEMSKHSNYQVDVTVWHAAQRHRILNDVWCVILWHIKLHRRLPFSMSSIYCVTIILTLLSSNVTAHLAHPLYNNILMMHFAFTVCRQPKRHNWMPLYVLLMWIHFADPAVPCKLSKLKCSIPLQMALLPFFSF